MFAQPTDSETGVDIRDYRPQQFFICERFRAKHGNHRSRSGTRMPVAVNVKSKATIFKLKTLDVLHFNDLRWCGNQNTLERLENLAICPKACDRRNMGSI